MEIADASKICESHGAALYKYRPPRMAMVTLRSREKLLISVGISTAKIFRATPLLGWLLPRCCASRAIAEWDSGYAAYDALQRNVCRGMILDGLLNLTSRAESVEQLCLAWCILKNPLDVASRDLFNIFPSDSSPSQTSHD
jgi:hypothetical protein